MTRNVRRARRKRRRSIRPGPLLLLVFLLALGGGYLSQTPEGLALLERFLPPTPTSTPTSVPTETPEPIPTPEGFYTLDTLPGYAGEPYVELEGNAPDFPDTDKTTLSFERYSDMDELGRCGPAYANVGPETMPTEERGPIGMVKPSGWHTIRYDFIDGNYLYNRCHLIAYMLTAENANECNLITGTRYLNVIGMLPFENQVADYVRETGNHVLYRVTPVFEDAELVARGVEMEALSVEDDGAGVCFHVFVYNVQPGVVIDYETGKSREEETK